jgi:hypothetical protein
MTRPVAVLVALLATPVVVGNVVAQVKSAADLARVQVGVGVTAETSRLLGSSTDAVVRAFEAALARVEMGSFAPGSQNRFMLAVDVQQLFEDVTPTAPPLVAVRARVSARFGDAATGRSFAEFSREVAVTGRTREQAYRTLGNRLRLDDDGWRNAAAEANTRIIRYFETQCEAVLGEAQTLMRGLAFEDALVALYTVPREAATCFARAQQQVGLAFDAMQEDACSRTFARARARWSANNSRESAREVADSIGEIPAGSVCFYDAEALLSDVIVVLADADSAVAQVERDEFALRKQVYQDAVDLARQRAQTDATLASAAQQQAFAEREVAGRLAVGFALKKASEHIGTPTIELRP